MSSFLLSCPTQRCPSATVDRDVTGKRSRRAAAAHQHASQRRLGHARSQNLRGARRSAAGRRSLTNHRLFLHIAIHPSIHLGPAPSQPPAAAAAAPPPVRLPPPSSSIASSVLSLACLLHSPLLTRDPIRNVSRGSSPAPRLKRDADVGRQVAGDPRPPYHPQ